MDKGLIGIIGVVLIVGGGLGYIPSTINNSEIGMILFAITIVLGVALCTYGFIDKDEKYY